MAADLDESYLDPNDFDVPAITLLQAYCRRWLVKKQLREAVIEFEQLVNDLDGPAYSVKWTESKVPTPSVSKLSRQQRKRKEDQGSGDAQRLEETGTTSRRQQVGVRDDSNSLITVEKDGHLSEDSVDPRQTVSRTSNQEVQTDFCQQPSVSIDTSRETATHERSSYGVVASASDQTQPSTQALTSAPQNVAAEEFVPVMDGANQWDAKGTTSLGMLRLDEDDIRNNCNTNNSNIKGTSAAEPFPSGTDSGSRVRIDSFHGDQTSVWDSNSSILQDHGWGTGVARNQAGVENRASEQVHSAHTAPELDPSLSEISTADLKRQRQNMAMELLWVQQAIISRKKYLRLKAQMQVTAPT